MGMFEKRSVMKARELDNTHSLSLESLLGISNDGVITEKEALDIPIVAACINKIAMIISSLEVKLYKEMKGSIIEEKDDYRLKLLNCNSGDTLTVDSEIVNFVQEYFLYGRYMAYIERKGNVIKSIRHVKNADIQCIHNFDPIFKDYYIQVNGKRYEPYQFLKIFKKTENGCEGVGILNDNKLILTTAYNAIRYENLMNKTGGNKRGFLQSSKKLSSDAMAELKRQWRAMYGEQTETCIVLNDGMDFKESSNTSVEMQLNEKKLTNAKEIASLFNIPLSAIYGGATSADMDDLRDTCIIPILEARTRSFNNDLLLEIEKENHYFAYDTKDLMKGNIKNRFEAYEIAINSGWMQLDDARYREDMPALDLPFIKLGLQDVLYNTNTNEIYTPNTNQMKKIDDVKGGENIEEQDESNDTQ